MASSPSTAAETIYLTAAQAGKVLNLSKKTLEKLRCEGSGPRFRKLGRSIRYTRGDIDAWADSNAYTTTAAPDYPDRRRP